MHSGRLVFGGLVLALACSSGGSGSGTTGTYAAVDGTPITMEFKSGGVFTMAAEGLGSSSGTYTVDGEKLIVSVDGQTHTFIRDGNCIEEPHIFGKLCKGGKSGEAANVSTRRVPTTPTGTWVASTADGEFRLEFRPGNTLALSMTPPGGQPDTKTGTFIVEGDAIHVTLEQGVPIVLKFVNEAYESTSFGFPMKFVGQ
jgi:hypothetical protein